jgi:uroporphyrin-III C-methyltransferase
MPRLPHDNVAAAGRVSLVGAGPGDPDLLTVRAARRLAEADVVLHDALLDPAILDLAREDARRIDVGKRCGRQAMKQGAINRLLLNLARGGLDVVRLKGGDPFIFGRGGEELLFLRAAGIAVDIVPGVTAAFAAAADLGMPLTHRGVARMLHFVTGHGADGRLPDLDFAALASGQATIAAYMAKNTCADLAARLVAAGLAPGTPAAAVENAGRAQQRHVRATLATLADVLAAQHYDGPTLLLVGHVIDLAATAAEALRLAA